MGAQITIVKDAVPNASRNFAFNGSLGEFKLDDPTTDDGDRYTHQRTFNVLPGVFTIHENLSDGWTLNTIVCSPAANATVDLANQTVTISVVSGDHVTCTFVNDAPTTGAITALKYYDANCNGIYDSAVDHWLAEWTMTVYTLNMTPIASGQTDNTGRVSFPSLSPGDYVVCETPKAGWTNSQPSIFGYRAPWLDHPCYKVEVDAGDLTIVKFGNFDFDAVLAASADVGTEGVAHFDLLSDLDQRLYEEGVNEFTLEYNSFLPLISQ
jgi:hypothetical protein